MPSEKIPLRAQKALKLGGRFRWAALSELAVVDFGNAGGLVRQRR